MLPAGIAAELLLAASTVLLEPGAALLAPLSGLFPTGSLAACSSLWFRLLTEWLDAFKGRFERKERQVFRERQHEGDWAEQLCRLPSQLPLGGAFSIGLDQSLLEQPHDHVPCLPGWCGAFDPQSLCKPSRVDACLVRLPVTNEHSQRIRLAFGCLLYTSDAADE